MGKYKNLIGNTIIFGISSFGSKLLTFFLIPVITSLFPSADLGIADYIRTVCNMILPVMYLTISEAIIRFGLDKTVRKRDIFTSGILTVLLGYGLFWCCYPLMRQFLAPNMQPYIWLIYAYVLASALRTVITHFVRASGFVRLFALDGIFTTINTVLFIFLFLVKLEMGVTGYLLATVCADGLSAVFLFFLLKLYRFFHIKGMRWDTARMMLFYAIPLVPTAVFWWITNLSDRIFIRKYWGDGLNGVYAISAQLPSAITLVSAFFTQAWQISAFTEYQSPEGEQFYSTVFKTYYTFVFLAASGIIMLAKPIVLIMAQQEEYYDAWRYVPFLVLAVAFSCLVTFLGTIYNAVKHNAMVTVTTAVGAAANLFLNWRLIPVYGAQGAAAATFVSFLIVFVIRAVDTRQYIRIRMQPLRLVLNLGLLLFQTWIALQEFERGFLYQILIFLLIVVCNLNYILFLFRRFWEMVGPFLKRRKAA